MAEKQYAKRDVIELDRLGGHYSRHVSAMTSEGLHEKGDIAAELAWRDARIAELEAKWEARVESHQDQTGEYDALCVTCGEEVDEDPHTHEQCYEAGKRVAVEMRGMHEWAAGTSLDPLKPGISVRHLNSDSLDNSTENLGLGSHADNMRDKPSAIARRAALTAAKARRSLTDEQAIDLVRLRREQGLSLRVLAERFGLRKGQVSEILSGKLYSSITGIEQKPRTRNDVPSHLQGVAC